VLRKGEELRRELHEIAHATERAEALDRTLERTRQEYLRAAGVLSTKRRAAATEFSRALEKSLGDLAMNRTRCEGQVRRG
jgi:DNA repair ATPase RecN